MGDVPRSGHSLLLAFVCTGPQLLRILILPATSKEKVRTGNLFLNVEWDQYLHIVPLPTVQGTLSRRWVRSTHGNPFSAERDSESRGIL